MKQKARGPLTGGRLQDRVGTVDGVHDAMVRKPGRLPGHLLQRQTAGHDIEDLVVLQGSEGEQRVGPEYGHVHLCHRSHPPTGRWFTLVTEEMATYPIDALLRLSATPGVYSFIRM